MTPSGTTPAFLSGPNLHLTTPTLVLALTLQAIQGQRDLVRIAADAGALAVLEARASMRALDRSFQEISVEGELLGLDIILEVVLWGELGLFAVIDCEGDADEPSSGDACIWE